MRVIESSFPEERSALRHSAGLPSFDARQIVSHSADTHLCVLNSSEEVVAHCSLWWKETPHIPDDTIGAIGHYASVDKDASAALLEHATAYLRANVCTLAVGPMDGNTWRRYRFVTDHGQGEVPEAAFFLEPTNPPEWPRQFVAAGFTPLAQYYSALNNNLTCFDSRLDAISSRLENSGVHIRSALNCDLTDQLKRIYQVSRIAFTRNFLYTELDEHSFLGQYAPLLSRIQPELILLAELNGALVGYLFAVPDFAQAARGRAIDTFLIKTVAILPDLALRGLGGLLVGRAHEAGRRLGFTRCIHALMHEDNISRNISNHYATTMRRYTLFSRRLTR